MILTGGRIDSFGLYSQTELPEFQRGLVLIFGENESGKTTLLEFLRQTLFGYNAANQRPYYETHNGERPGGELGFLLADGERVTLSRTGARGGAAVFGKDGRALGPETLTRLTAGLSAEAYQTLFALTLDDLRALDARDDAGIVQVLYGAALGARPEALRNGRRQLETEAKALFLPRGQNPTLNAAARDARHAEKDARRIRKLVEQHAPKAAEVDRLRAHASELEERVRAARDAAARARRLAETWESWFKLQRLRDHLSERSEPPDKPLERLLRDYETARAAAQGLEQQQARQRAEARGRRKSLAEFQIDENLLEASPEIEAVRAELSGWRAQRAAAAEALRRAESADDEAHRCLNRLGAEWTPERARAVSLGVETVDRLDRARQELDAAERDEASAKLKLDAARNDRDALVEKKTELERRRGDHIDSPALAPAELPAFERRRTRAMDARESADDTAGGIRNAEEELMRALVHVAPSWDLDRLASFDAAATAAGALGQTAAQLEAAHQASGSAAALHAAAKEAVLEARQREEAHFQTMPAPPSGVTSAEQLDAHRKRLTALETAAAEARAAGAELSYIQERLESLGRERTLVEGALRSVKATVWTGLALLAVAIAAGAAGLMMSGELGPGFLILAGLLTVVGGILLWRSLGAEGRDAEEQASRTEARRKALEAERAQATARVQKAQEALAAAGSEYGEATPVGEARLRQLRFEFEAVANRWSEYEAAVARHQELLEATAAATQASLARQKEVDRAGNDVRAAEEAFLAARRAVGLGDGTTLGNWRSTLARLEALLSDLRRLTSDRRREEGARGRWKEFEEEVRKLAPELPLDATPEAIELAADELAHAARAAVHEEAQDRELDRQAVELQRDLQAAETELQSAINVHAATRRRLDQATEDWRDLLKSFGLSADLTPDGARETLDAVGEFQRVDAEADRFRAEAKGVLRDVGAFETRARALIARLGRSERDSAGLAAAVEELVADVESTRKEATRRQALRERLAEDERTLQTLAADLELHTRRQTEALDEAGCASAEELQRAVDAAEDYRSLRASERNLVEQCLKTASLASEEELVAALKGADGDALAAAADEAAQRVEELGHQRDNVRDALLHLERDLSEIFEERRLEEALGRAEAARARARTAAERWARLRLAQWLLDEARARFERDHQPEVFRQAGRLLEAVTQGRYNVVARSVDRDGELLVRRPSGETVPASRLSRGAREQLFFVLRLANAACFSPDGERLPFILDDVLVNFDESRARAALRALELVANEDQVLLFTCHAWVRHLVKDAAPGAQVLELCAGSFVVE